jgi:hypothetical protein
VRVGVGVGLGRLLRRYVAFYPCSILGPFLGDIVLVQGIWTNDRRRLLKTKK